MKHTLKQAIKQEYTADKQHLEFRSKTKGCKGNRFQKIKTDENGEIDNACYLSELSRNCIPIIKQEIIRIIIAVAHPKDLLLEQMDVRNTFLNEKVLSEVVLMKQPKDFEARGSSNKELVLAD